MSKNISKSAESFSSIPKIDQSKSDQNIDILDRVTDKAKEAGKFVREFANDSQAKTNELIDETEQRIRRHPFSTSAIVFLSGAVIGYLLRGK